jgi:16S rRNA (guanine527-N7)-methyltransferase
VNSLEFRDRLARRARRAKAPLTLAMLEPLEAYFRLLELWNAKINLTALPLGAPTDATFDRLLVEPLAAGPHLTWDKTATRSAIRPRSDPNVWFDLGSGGGSPAIPLLIARPTLKLTMIESKARKAAFLREAIRVLGLTNATVMNARFEDVARADEHANGADFVTVRAVKADGALFEAAGQLLKEAGRLLLFRPSHDPSPDPPGFTRASTVQLMDAPQTFLCNYKRVFHVEQRGRI